MAERAGDPREPPGLIWFDVDEALELLAILEEVHEQLVADAKLVLVLPVEAQILALNRKLEFDEGGSDG